LTDLSNIPKGPHWAIISTTSVTIPGDERSRTNPGHGYPESTETFITYQAFTSQAEWEREVERRIVRKYRAPFRALKVEPAEVNVRVSVG
jgi:hypothetical protein